MAKKKEIVIKNGRYAGKYLTDKDCSRLESLLKLDESRGCVEDLKHVIYDLPSSVVEEIKSFGSVVSEDSLRIGTLEDSQTVGVAYMYFAKRLLSGDSVGLGKTVEVAGLCNLLQQSYKKEGRNFRFLMLTNKTILDEICDKMIQFTGNYVYKLYGEKSNVNSFIKEYGDFLPDSVVGAHSLLKNPIFQEYIINYKNVTGECPFDILIVDESGDVLTNTTTQYYEGGKYLASFFDRVILLNATPFEKELRQFYAQLSFIDDTFLPTKTEFSKKYEVFDYGRARYPVFSGKYRNADEFMYLVKYRYLKRTRRDIGGVMRDCNAELLIAPLTSKQRELLKMVSMPAMVYDCPSYFPFANIPTNIETTPKLASLVDLVKDRFKDDGSILVYARYKEAQYCIKSELEAQGISVAIMNGDTPNELRNQYIRSFKLGDIKVLVTSVQKGLDFGNCNICIFYDYDPNPANMVQFEGRTTRSRDIIGKTVILLVSRGKELKNLREVVADRAQASELFSGSDFSCVLGLLSDCKELK